MNLEGGMEKTLKVLNRLVEEEVIGRYAVVHYAHSVV
jgi:hypothetical protein